jgi:hypothetical protein
MATIQRREKPAKRSVRRITHWTEQNHRLFLAYAEYLDESDDLDYALMAMVEAVAKHDVEFDAWHKQNPKAGEAIAKPKKAQKPKRIADRTAA